MIKEKRRLVFWIRIWWEDTNDPIDPASKESVTEAIISGAQLTDRVDLSKLNCKSKK